MERARIRELMEMMAAGDVGAAVALKDEFGCRIGGRLRRELRRLGVRWVAPEELDGLVLDACLVLYDCAPAWDPDGALPWTWAWRRLAALASSWVGIHAEGLDGTEATAQAPAVAVSADDDRSEMEVLAGLAADHPGCALLVEALGRAGSDRNQTVLLDVKVQASLGDPSPAVTVGQELGMRPEAVRQVVKRTRDRLQHVVASEPRFAPLADMALLSS